ncbi:NAD(P)H-binding protein [Amycolatopsis thailandensis]|uniref:NmrA family NAD(P)-binding protein n=1 Tax=Amycolatopsis thailandensis TaxID=589330 RepID=UPI0036648AAC
MTVLVTGATGNTGRHVVAELVRRGERVRALSRNPAEARLPAGVEVVRGTHTEPETLSFDGVTRLHITATAGLADVGADLVKRAVDAGVRRMTIVWGGYVGPTEQAMAESGMEWTRLEPQEFMSNALTWADSVRGGNVVREPFDLPSAVVHEADIGAVAATALTEDGHSGKVYNLTGPESLTTRDRIAILGAALGRDIGLEQITRQQAVDRLLADGVSTADAEYVIGWHSDPPAEARTVDRTVEKVLGRPARTFAQWVGEHVDRFRD